MYPDEINDTETIDYIPPPPATLLAMWRVSFILLFFLFSFVWWEWRQNLSHFQGITFPKTFQQGERRQRCECVCVRVVFCKLSQVRG